MDEMTFQLVLGSGFVIFFVGSTFWAGATYNRVSSIEKAIQDVRKELGSLTHVAVLVAQMDGVHERLNRLERFHA